MNFFQLKFYRSIFFSCNNSSFQRTILDFFHLPFFLLEAGIFNSTGLATLNSNKLTLSRSSSYIFFSFLYFIRDKLHLVLFSSFVVLSTDIFTYSSQALRCACIAYVFMCVCVRAELCWYLTIDNTYSLRLFAMPCE